MAELRPPRFLSIGRDGTHPFSEPRLDEGEILKVCNERARLVAAVPLKTRTKRPRRRAGRSSQVGSRLGQLVRTTLVGIATRSEIPFSSSMGFQGMKPKAQRSRLKGDV